MLLRTLLHFKFQILDFLVLKFSFRSFCTSQSFLIFLFFTYDNMLLFLTEKNFNNYPYLIISTSGSSQSWYFLIIFFLGKSSYFLDSVGCIILNCIVGIVNIILCRPWILLYYFKECWSFFFFWSQQQTWLGFNCTFSCS